MIRVRSHKYPKEDEEYVDTTHYDEKRNNLDIGYQRLKFINIKSYPQLSRVKSLFVDHNNLKSLPDSGCMPHLTELNCSYNLLSQIPFYPNLTFLNISNNKMISIKEYQNSILEYLDCSFNPGFIFDLKLSHCEHLYINDNGIDQINLSGLPKLQYLDCSSNNLTTINPSETLIELNSQRNHLMDLPLFPNANIIMTDDNSIKMLLTYPKLSILTISHNKMSHIDPQPNLVKLIASHNYVEHLGAMPKLEILDIGYNNLKIIDIPITIQSMSIHFNPISKINLSPENFKYLRDIQVSFNTYKTIYSALHKYFQSIHIKVSIDKLNELLVNLESIFGGPAIEYLRLKFHKTKFQDRDEMLLTISLKIFWLMFPQKKNIPILEIVKTPEFNNLYDGITKLYYKTIVITLIFRDDSEEKGESEK